MRKALTLISMVGALAMSASASAAPVFDTFGSLPQATFGGSGIPNDAVAIASQNNITLGLTATERFVNPPVGDDGAGTFFAGTGSNFGDPSMPAGPGPSSSLGATWNFGFFIDLGNQIATDFTTLSLQYDFDPSAGTDFGVIHFNLNPLTVGFSLIEDSQNLLFAFLAGSPVIPGIIAPGGSFDPNLDGIYSFILTASGGGLTGDLVASIDVVVGNPVTNAPEPGTLALFGAGLTGLILARRRRKSVN